MLEVSLYLLIQELHLVRSQYNINPFYRHSISLCILFVLYEHHGLRNRWMQHLEKSEIPCHCCCKLWVDYRWNPCQLLIALRNCWVPIRSYEDGKMLWGSWHLYLFLRTDDSFLFLIHVSTFDSHFTNRASFQTFGFTRNYYYGMTTKEESVLESKKEYLKVLD